jgi:hypothetical protein
MRLSLTHEGVDLVLIEFEALRESVDFAEYSVRFIVDRSGSVGIHSRVVSIDPSKDNALALIRSALDLLEEEWFEVEDDAGPPNLAWRLGRALREIQGG